MEKKLIFYPRTYRHLKTNKVQFLLINLFVMIPAFLALIFNIDEITSRIALISANILGKIFPGVAINIAMSDYSILGKMSFVDLPTIYPSVETAFISAIIMVLGLVFLSTGSRKGKPIAIFFTIGVTIHLINSIYFIFAANYFPYSAFRYSDLYMKQQIGIWMMFIILSGMIIPMMGSKGTIYKIFTFLGIMSYSIVFGIVRYIVFLYIIYNFSIFYMAIMFFVLGPAFDFLYLVAIYGIFIDKMVHLYDSASGRDEWTWS